MVEYSDFVGFKDSDEIYLMKWNHNISQRRRTIKISPNSVSYKSSSGSFLYFNVTNFILLVLNSSRFCCLS